MGFIPAGRLRPTNPHFAATGDGSRQDAKAQRIPPDVGSGGLSLVVSCFYSGRPDLAAWRETTLEFGIRPGCVHK